jgi:hypothetical protein
MLRVGVLYRIGHVLDYLASTSLSEAQFLTSFGNWEGIPGDTIIDTCKRFGWITATAASELCLTPIGKSLCEVRNPPARLRLQIDTVISITRPAWAALAARGRNAVESYAPSEAVQCLSEASLLDGTDEEVVSWWDRLATYYRSIRDDDKMLTGRLGERASFNHEIKRTISTPNWVALDTNNAGYDLISRIDREDARRLLIEVKASQLDWEDAEAILTRHEWDVLSQSHNACIDLWVVSRRPFGFRRVDISGVRSFIPADVPDGRWLTLSLPFRMFGPPEVIPTL